MSISRRTFLELPRLQWRVWQLVELQKLLLNRRN